MFHRKPQIITCYPYQYMESRQSHGKTRYLYITVCNKWRETSTRLGTPISTKRSLESSWTWQESMKLDQSQTSTPRQDINWDAGGKRVRERFFLPRQSRYTRTRKILNELPTFYRSNFFLHVPFFFFLFHLPPASFSLFPVYDTLYIFSCHPRIPNFNSRRATFNSLTRCQFPWKDSKRFTLSSIYLYIVFPFLISYKISVFLAINSTIQRIFVKYLLSLANDRIHNIVTYRVFPYFPLIFTHVRFYFFPKF